MQTRQIGTRTVSALGLGAMPMSVREENDRERAEATIRAALDLGVTLIDTADAYSRDEEEFGHNEVLVAEVLRRVGLGPDDVLVATKGGHTRRGTDWELDGSRDYLHRACRASLQRLGVDSIGLYQHHRPDPEVPYAESIGALRDLLDAGKIRMAGISNADPDQIRRAQEVLGGRLASVQNEFSPGYRSSEPELELCAELGIAFLPWSPLGGIGSAADLGSRNDVFAQVAGEVGATPQQVALAWELAKAPVVVPIPGSSRPETVRASAQAVDLVLTAEQLTRLG
jgi:aryl-alcohol dehydrogenase-like predicted oxidoreductase